MRERENAKEKDRMGRGVGRNEWRMDRRQGAAILVDVQRGGAEMLVRLSPAVVSSASRRLQTAARRAITRYRVKASSVGSVLQNELRLSGDKTRIRAGYAKESYD